MAEARGSRRRAAALGAVVLLAAACGGSADTGPAADTEPSADTVAADEGAARQDTGETSASQADARGRFVEALDALGTSYFFDAELTTTSADSVHVSGRRHLDALEYTVHAAGRDVRTVAIGEDLFVTSDGETRLLSRAGGNSGDPLEDLAAPDAVEEHASITNALVLTYPASIVGKADGGTVEVTVTLSDDAMRFQYSDAQTVMSTVLEPDPAPSEITPPAGGY